ncbi:hypothetical protein Ocin01_09349 [Orchesella cincta]|uniref:Uncharacterized protein n=1 Tax=Orchesella cincta TaxID=48709 RepID=A0A1D2MX06_ORCCI|nr:hypothetical protein Ocin01_09349 [Orchesella cincta]
MSGVRQSAQLVNGRWWFLKNSTGVSTGQPVNGRWWFLRSNSTQAFSNAQSSADANSRKFFDPSRSNFARKY